MPVRTIRNRYIIQYNNRSVDKYWPELSASIVILYGTNPISYNIEEVLLHSFNFIKNKFQTILQEESCFEFYAEVFIYMEHSLLLWNDHLKGLLMNTDTLQTYGVYKRSLYLILEQAVNLDLKSSRIADTYWSIFDEKLEDLLFLSEWLYRLAAFITEIKTVGDSIFIEFDSNNILDFSRKNFFNEVHNSLYEDYVLGYSDRISDDQIDIDFFEIIQSCFGINTKESLELFYKHLKPSTSKSYNDLYSFKEIVDKHCQIYHSEHQFTESFYRGLLLYRENAPTIDESVLKPLNPRRYLYRPFLEFSVNGYRRIMFSPYKLFESIKELSFNNINWEKAPEEWIILDCIKDALLQRKQIQESIFNEKIDKILTGNRILYDKNVKSLESYSGENTNIIHDPGEIDFLYIDQINKIINIIECKYSIPKFDIVSDRADYSKFKDVYEKKLDRRLIFFEKKSKLLYDHLNIKLNTKIDFNEYTIVGLFFVNTPTMYNLTGKYRAYHISKIKDYLANNRSEFKHKLTYDNKEYSIKEPFFKSALEISKSL